jgi:hypothetical protein
MKTLKMSLENIQGKMSRKEMRNIMAGSGTTCPMKCLDKNCMGSCTCYHAGTSNEYCGTR